MFSQKLLGLHYGFAVLCSQQGSIEFYSGLSRVGREFDQGFTEILISYFFTKILQRC